LKVVRLTDAKVYKVEEAANEMNLDSKTIVASCSTSEKVGGHFWAFYDKDLTPEDYAMIKSMKLNIKVLKDT
jgi:hypothetical protein